MLNALGTAANALASRIRFNADSQNNNLIGHVRLNGANVEVKESKWDGMYQLGNSGKLTISSEVLRDTGQGELVVNDGDLETLERFHNEWENNSLGLIRGISSSHYSWDNAVINSRAVSEAEIGDDRPQATMGGSQSLWLPTSIASNPGALDVAAGVAIGNHTQTMRNSLSQTNPQANVLLGAVLSFPAGCDRELNVHYLNPGEILVQGPLNKWNDDGSTQNFTISHLVISNPQNVAGYSAMQYSGRNWDSDLMPHTEFDPLEQNPLTQEMTQAWMDRSALKIQDLHNRDLLQFQA